MDAEIGSILTGKVTGITKFGAFVTFAPGKSGLVHISEIANSYVNDVGEHLKQGQEVRVKVIGISDNGRINLSIKAALSERTEDIRPSPARESRVVRAAPAPQAVQRGAEPSFEEKLKRFMQDSDSKMSGIKQFPDKRGSRRRK